MIDLADLSDDDLRAQVLAELRDRAGGDTPADLGAAPCVHVQRKMVHCGRAVTAERGHGTGRSGWFCVSAWRGPGVRRSCRRTARPDAAAPHTVDTSSHSVSAPAVASEQGTARDHERWTRWAPRP